MFLWSLEELAYNHCEARIVQIHRIIRFSKIIS